MASIPIAIGTMATPEPATSRLLKKPLKAEFTRIYISFYNSFTMSGNAGAYVWIREVKTIFAYETFQEIVYHYFNLLILEIEKK
jgi:hypothetical protein